MQKDYKPLIRRTRLKPDESLLSLLVRLTALNSYEALSLLKGLIFESSDSLQPLRDNLEFPLKLSTYEKLFSLVQVDISSLYLCTSHRFAPILTPLSQDITYTQLSDNVSVPIFLQDHPHRLLRPQYRAQFCPNCLKKEVYYNLRWAPIAVSVCLQHKCLLLDSCYECHQEVSSIAIARSRCDQCQADLSMAKTVSVCNDELGLCTQQIIQSWLMEFTTPSSVISLLPQQPARVLYWLIEDLQLFLGTLKNRRWKYIHRLEGEEEQLQVNASPISGGDQLLSPYESYQLYTTACKSIVNWPESFFNFLYHYINRNAESLYPRYQEQKGRLISGMLATSLGDLYTRWLPQRWKSEEYGFLRDTFNSYIANNYWFSDVSEFKSFCKKNPELAESCMYATITDAAHLLEISPEAVEFLVGNDQVLCKTLDEDAVKLVKREKVLDLVDTKRKAIPLQGVAVRLGLPMNMIKDLVRAGMFSEGEIQIRNFSLEEVTSIGERLFLRKILQHTKVLPQEDIDDKRYYVNIFDAGRLLSVANLTIAALFLQVAICNLWAYAPKEPQQLRLDHLLFLCTDIQMLATKHETQRPFLLKQAKAANVLRVKEEILEKWVRKGVIIPNSIDGRGLYFEPTIVDEFMRKFIFGEEAIKVLGLEMAMLKSILSSPTSLTHICFKGFDLSWGYKCVFEREMLIQWRKERLTFDETIKMLKISESTFQIWLKDGKITCTDFINDKPTWFLQQEVLVLNK